MKVNNKVKSDIFKVTFQEEWIAENNKITYGKFLYVSLYNPNNMSAVKDNILGQTQIHSIEETLHWWKHKRSCEANCYSWTGINYTFKLDFLNDSNQ